MAMNPLSVSDFARLPPRLISEPWRCRLLIDPCRSSGGDVVTLVLLDMEAALARWDIGDEDGDRNARSGTSASNWFVSSKEGGGRKEAEGSNRKQ